MADASHTSFLPPILTFCAGAVLAVPLFRRLGQSAVLGYLAAGIVIGPSVLAVIKDPDTIRGTAEIGVVLLLFLVGLELQPERLYSMRKDILGAGLAQMTLSAGLIGAVAWGFGLSRRRCGRDRAGAGAVGDLDRAAIAGGARRRQRGLWPAHLLDPAVPGHLDRARAGAAAAAGDDRRRRAAAPSRRMAALGLAAAAVAAIVLAGRYALNPFFRILAKTGAKEVMTAAALLIVLGAALLMEHVGLSMAMGAFLAGVLLADSHFRHELEADIEPFRGVLLGLFFMAVGMSLDLALVLDNALLLALAAPLLVLVKIAIAASILRASCSSMTEAVRAGALLSPAGEFAFVLLPLGVSLGLLNDQQGAIATALAALSMLLGPVLAKLIDGFLLSRATAETMEEDFEGAGAASVVVIGFGRFGQIVTQALLLQHIDVTVIDSDVERIRSAAKFGFKVYYGDGTRLDVLQRGGRRQGARDLHLRRRQGRRAAHRRDRQVGVPAARIHARAYDRIHAIELMKAEVDYQMRETFESALGFGRVTLEGLGLTYDEASLIIDHVRERDAAAHGDPVHAKASARRSTKVPRVTPEPLVKPKAQVEGADGRDRRIDRGWRSGGRGRRRRRAGTVSAPQRRLAGGLRHRLDHAPCRGDDRDGLDRADGDLPRRSAVAALRLLARPAGGDGRRRLRDDRAVPDDFHQYRSDDRGDGADRARGSAATTATAARRIAGSTMALMAVAAIALSLIALPLLPWLLRLLGAHDESYAVAHRPS